MNRLFIKSILHISIVFTLCAYVIPAKGDKYAIGSLANLVSGALTLSSKSDDFSGDGQLIGFTTNNESDLPDVKRVSGRYRANLTDNSGNKTLHFHDAQGRLDAKRLSFPFEFIARNIGIGTQTNSQIPIPSTGGVNFAGVQVHVLDLDSRYSSHIVVGHRASIGFTLEGKNTVYSRSRVNDIGRNKVPSGRADIRVVGNDDHSLTIYWQLPNQSEDNWQLYNGDGRLPGPAPAYGTEVYVGLITYAEGNQGVPFVGTCDAIEIYDAEGIPVVNIPLAWLDLLI